MIVEEWHGISDIGDPKSVIGNYQEAEKNAVKLRGGALDTQPPSS